MAGETPAPLVKREDLMAAIAELHATREAIDAAVKTAVDDKTKNWRRVGIGLAVALVVAFLGLAGLGVVAWQAKEDREDLAALVAAQASDTDQRRIDACERDNTSRAANRLVALTTAGGFTQFAAILIGNEEIDEDLRQDIETFQNTVVDPLVALTDAEEGSLADRDCTPEGLGITTGPQAVDEQ